MKEKDLPCFGLVFTACWCLEDCWHLLLLHKIAEDANNLSSTEQAVKTLPKQHKSFSFIFHHFCLFICCLSVILWLDKWDIPENVHTVCPC